MTPPSSGESGFNSDRLLEAGCNPCTGELNAVRQAERSQRCMAAVVHWSHRAQPTPADTALNPSLAAGDLHSAHKLLMEN